MCVCVEMNVRVCVESECKFVERVSVLESECVESEGMCLCRKWMHVCVVCDCVCIESEGMYKKWMCVQKVNVYIENESVFV